MTSNMTSFTMEFVHFPLFGTLHVAFKITLI